MHMSPAVIAIYIIVALSVHALVWKKIQKTEAYKEHLDLIAHAWGIHPEHLPKTCAVLTAIALFLVIVCWVLLSLKN